MSRGAHAALGRPVLVAVLAVVAVALGARFSFVIPGAAVPQSAQTLMVVLVGAWAGWAVGPLAMICYIVVGALGAPVFADGSAGLKVALGPSAGYLVGFVIAAFAMGVAYRRAVSLGGYSRFAALFGAALCAHAFILGAGSVRLAALVGLEASVSSGVTPFLLGGVVKSAIAAAVIEVQLRASAQG